MPNDEFADAALVLVAHGSMLNADSALPAFQHADAFREAGRFAEVVECFWKQEPAIAGVLRGVWAPRVFVVPLFISDGYFTEEVIPRELGLDRRADGKFSRVQRRGNQTIFYCEPVGTHPSMTSVLLTRAQDVLRLHPRPDGVIPEPRAVALIIAGHGTSKNENSRQAIEQQVEWIRRAGIFAEVHPAFMEESPRIGDIYTMTACENLVMVPFFISDGLHSHEDIPVLLGERASDVQARLAAGQPTWHNPTPRSGRWVWYTRSIGNEAGLPQVILERVRDMAHKAAKD